MPGPTAARRRAARGFTLIELLAVIAIVAMLLAILLPALGRARGTARQLKDATQLRSIVQGMVVWSQHHRDRYPLPSEIDLADATMNEAEPFHKDNTGNLCSLLVFNGFVPPAMFVTPAEVNDTIVPDEHYEYSEPQAALDPPNALWDPGFGGVPGETDGTGIGRGRRWYGTRGYVSYGHTAPFGKRLGHWGGTYSATEAVFANRGPLYGGSPGEWVLAPGGQGVGSNTLRIHGSERSWEGNIALNDGRVVFVTRPDPAELPWTYADRAQNPRTLGDNIFVNEDDRTGEPLPDNPPGTNRNAWLRPFRNVRGTPGAAGAMLTAFID